MNNINACGFHCIKMNDIGVNLGGQQILENVNIHIHCGKICAIIGKNGAGKSTLIRAIIGEIPHTGTIELKNVKAGAMENMKVGYVPQHINIDRSTPTSVYDLIAGYTTKFPVFLKKKKKTYEHIREALKVFDAEDLIDKQLSRLSGGELQRVLLSLAVMGRPNLLLLDEPVSGIDQNGMTLFYETIDKLKKNYDMSIILISHDLDYVKKYADQVILLDKTVLISGTADEVYESSEYQKVFGES